eukprot:scaffold73717_cov69-Phaeocystis_antarctica.AAC.2
MLALISCCVPGLRAPGPAALSRRQVLALTAATGVAPLPALADMALAPPQPSAQDFLSLKLQGRRLEPAALDAVKAFYSEEFCAYLARWLICYEPATTRWWVAKQAEARDFESAQVTRGTPFALSNDAKREVRRRISSTAAILTLTLAIRARPPPAHLVSHARPVTEVLALQVRKPRDERRGGTGEGPGPHWRGAARGEARAAQPDLQLAALPGAALQRTGRGTAHGTDPLADRRGRQRASAWRRDAQGRGGPRLFEDGAVGGGGRTR